MPNSPASLLCYRNAASHLPGDVQCRWNGDSPLWDSCQNNDSGKLSSGYKGFRASTKVLSQEIDSMRRKNRFECVREVKRYADNQTNKEKDKGMETNF